MRNTNEQGTSELRVWSSLAVDLKKAYDRESYSGHGMVVSWFMVVVMAYGGHGAKTKGRELELTLVGLELRVRCSSCCVSA